MPIDPCGAPIDLLRTCYRSLMRFNADDCDCVAEVQWYFTDRTDFIQNDAFVSSIYDEVHPADGCPVGEIGANHRKTNGQAPLGTSQGMKPCGTAEQWSGEIHNTDEVCPECLTCPLQGYGCSCVSGKGAFARSVMAGSGCACVRGGSAWWQGVGCTCSFGIGSWLHVAANPCACATPQTGLQFRESLQSAPCSCAAAKTAVGFPRISAPCVCFLDGDEWTIHISQPMTYPQFWLIYKDGVPTYVNDPQYGRLYFVPYAPQVWKVTAPDGGVWTWYQMHKFGTQFPSPPPIYHNFLTFTEPIYGIVSGGQFTSWVGSPPWFTKYFMADPLTRVSGLIVEITQDS